MTSKISENKIKWKREIEKVIKKVLVEKRIYKNGDCITNEKERKIKQITKQNLHILKFKGQKWEYECESESESR